MTRQKLTISTASLPPALGAVNEHVQKVQSDLDPRSLCKLTLVTVEIPLESLSTKNQNFFIGNYWPLRHETQSASIIVISTTPTPAPIRALPAL